MGPQNQTTQSNPSSQQPQPETPPKKDLPNSRLSVAGLILAVLCPPVGLVVSVLALREIKKNYLRGRGRAIFGVIWGAIFTVPFLLLAWLFIALGGWKGNEAKKAAQPFIAQVQKAGGKKICDNGDSGDGIDNTQPWYEVYYELPNSPSLTSDVKAYAASIGYPLAQDTASINQLKGIPDKNGVTTEPDGGATFNPSADYLISNRNGSSLAITINRKTSVALYCGVGDYGAKRSTGNNAILDIHFTSPDRSH
jgi:Domain of unknown function (DUF4190)